MIGLRLDLSAIQALGNRFQEAGKQAPLALRRAVAHTGPKANTGMRGALVEQTGLSRKTMNKALRGKMQGNSFVIRVKGGDAKLSKFKARETRAGVSAAPWNKRRVYQGTFLKGGHFPNRVAIPKLHGVALIRKGKARYPLATARSGVVLPNEMVIGKSKQAFEAVVQRDLLPRFEHELSRILG